MVLLAGIGTSILLFSRMILYLLTNHPIPLWSFFFGLIVASTLLVYRTIRNKQGLITWIALLLGVGIAYFITSGSPTETPDALWFIFLSGMVAICAMILPGISGSFILLLLGKYEYILTSLKQLNLSVLFTFAAGCLLGLLSFANLLSWLLKRYHDSTVALLTGFMVGSLNKVWPWKVALETYVNSKGVVKPLVEQNLLPWNYAQITGLAPQLALSVVFLLLGFALVVGIDKLASRSID
jgi:putative membrane protein